VANHFLYNGPTETNPTTGWGETLFRTYDPVLARFHQVDPLAAKYASLSPYNYAFNNPVTFNDPTGAEPYNNPNYYHGNGPRGAYVYTDLVYTDGGYPHRDRGAWFNSGVNLERVYGKRAYGILTGTASANQWAQALYMAQMHQDSRNMSAADYGAKYGVSGTFQIIDYYTNGDRDRYINSDVIIELGGQHRGADTGAGTSYRWFDYTSETRAAIVTDIPFVIMVTQKGQTRPAKKTIFVTVMIQLPKTYAISSDDFEKREWMNPNEASRLTDASIRTAHLETVMTIRTTNWAGLESLYTRTFTRYLESQLSMRFPGLDLPGVPGARVISRQNIPSQYMIYATPFVP
jgi:RHS repeat-associated protein